MPAGDVLEEGASYCISCRADARYQVIDMTGDGERMDRQWLCPGNHRDTHVQHEYPQYTWEGRRKLAREAQAKADKQRSEG
ncbi:hypothetical protein [Mycobacterium bourgelatii]|uniref:Uncharacterized protein n=1 Tax=Mycobacterium bourgelatii TaxID=1273442 RepID=A0A7I9YT77_MYCBU|nr:hypothetical protein [Mycobacterium bourgelatii]MCV6975828.1 hypothetical protein [Mycobacterium bourgelatii]GFG91884.1 hypothetical protein MBOU_39260 [Mycobacterium bourgelatii]